ncbi:MAG: hypothetical protein Q8R01_14965 [Ramlibacter sp.]|nr:hypothetical protein [Ramlibacter sp.]
MQSIALQITAGALAVLTAGFAWVMYTSGGPLRSEAATHAAYRLRHILFLAALVAGAAIAAATLFPWPHDAHASAITRKIDVKARQWAWELSGQQAAVGDVVEFTLTTSDVSHGFGLYDPDNRLVAQMQVMPGFTNKVRHQFDRPGKYQILCMEYCGLAHHAMVAHIDVAVTGAAASK